MERKLEVEGKEYRFACNALTPRLYRAKFGRDLMLDLKKFGEDYTKDPYSVNYEPLENMAWIMLKAGSGPEVARENPEEWLATLDSPTTVYELVPDLMDIWRASQKTTAIPKKK